jgi:hypothetical protein
MHFFWEAVSWEVIMNFSFGCLHQVSETYFRQETCPDQGEVKMGEDGIENESQA